MEPDSLLESYIHVVYENEKKFRKSFFENIFSADENFWRSKIFEDVRKFDTQKSKKSDFFKTQNFRSSKKNVQKKSDFFDYFCRKAIFT